MFTQNGQNGLKAESAVGSFPVKPCDQVICGGRVRLQYALIDAYFLTLPTGRQRGTERHLDALTAGHA